MAYKQFRNDDYISDINKKLNLINIEKPIIDKHSAFIRAKMKPTLDVVNEDTSLLTDSEIRNKIIRDLSPILHNQTVNFVETLGRNNDLKAFYAFYNVFVPTIKNIRNLDSSFMQDLWNKFKDKMRIESESIISTTFPGIKASEYERIIREKSEQDELERQRIHELEQKTKEEAKKKVKKVKKKIVRGLESSKKSSTSPSDISLTASTASTAPSDISYQGHGLIGITRNFRR